ncbi:hypothetical protein CVT24_008927 [Panaeolus cyanescens]|uniref:F-box domain-containing protein n=1 Tax=Panaeolus cyanescens TaxID=181874 RepID=A0A409VEC1_9AGAR|nr:hypothetical protein CVT24_008927 [Panaeolus cyanescens]
MSPPILYHDIIDQILSCFNLFDGDERNELSNCALVCKQWCQLSRRLLFKNIDDISVGEIETLREILRPRFETCSHPGKSTFAEYVRSAYSMIDLGMDSWSDAKELLCLLRDSFPLEFEFSLLLTGKSLTSQHLVDIHLSMPNVVHLGLVGVEIRMSPVQIRRLCGKSGLPRLKRLSVCASGWNTEVFDNAIREEKATNSVLAIENLLFQELRPFDMSTRFWPHEAFPDLDVKTLQIQAKIDNASFWDAVPSLLDKVSPNLVGLDVSYALDYQSTSPMASTGSVVLRSQVRLHQKHSKHALPEAANAGVKN